MSVGQGRRRERGAFAIPAGRSTRWQKIKTTIGIEREHYRRKEVDATAARRLG